MPKRMRCESLWAIAMLLLPTAIHAQAGAPEHMVTYMTDAGQTECPDGWTEAGYAQGRLVLGTTDGADVQKAAGEPAADAKAPGHSHAFEVSGAINAMNLGTDPAGSVPRAADGRVSASGTTHPFAPTLPFIQFLVCEKTTAPQADATPFGAIAYFNAPACPSAWSASDQANGRFVLVAPASGKPGSEVGTPWDPASPPSHTHTLASQFKFGTQTFESWPSGSHSNAGQPNTYPLEGSAKAAGPVLPFVSLLACERTEGFGNGEGLPSGMSVFFGGEDCPDGWGETVGADGRFVVGIGGNGTQGATMGSDPIDANPISIQHDHGFGGSVWVPAAKVGAAPYRPNMAYSNVFGGAGFAGFGGATSHASASAEVPYLVLQSCTKE